MYTSVAAEIATALRKPGRGRIRDVRRKAADMIDLLAGDLTIARAKCELYNTAIAKRRLLRAVMQQAVAGLDRGQPPGEVAELLRAALDADAA